MGEGGGGGVVPLEPHLVPQLMIILLGISIFQNYSSTVLWSLRHNTVLQQQLSENSYVDFSLEIITWYILPG